MPLRGRVRQSQHSCRAEQDREREHRRPGPRVAPGIIGRTVIPRRNRRVQYQGRAARCVDAHFAIMYCAPIGQTRLGRFSDTPDAPGREFQFAEVVQPRVRWPAALRAYAHAGLPTTIIVWLLSSAPSCGIGDPTADEHVQSRTRRPILLRAAWVSAPSGTSRRMPRTWPVRGLRGDGRRQIASASRATEPPRPASVMLAKSLPAGAAPASRRRRMNSRRHLHGG